MQNAHSRIYTFLLLCIVLCLTKTLCAADFPQTIRTVKPSIVGVGSYEKLRSPAVKFVGTGFAVGNGLSIITNAHVVSTAVTGENETLGIVIGKGNDVQFRPAETVAVDTEHDLALLKIQGEPLPPMEVGDSGKIVEGQSVAFTGFPLGLLLGLNHTTHRAIISAITPIVMPARGTATLDAKTIAQLRRPLFNAFQLDGTAFPGNSGSPVYDPETGTVYGVINMVAIRGVKENASTNPSGIAYAIPSRYVHELMQGK
jgi:serine protease Do